MKVSSDNFAEMLGISRRSLFNKEHGLTPWYLSELVTITEIMKANGVEEQLTVFFDGKPYIVDFEKVA